jgi:hypothetical protein
MDLEKLRRPQRLPMMRALLVTLAVVLPLAAQAELVVITDSFGIPEGRGGAAVGWPEHLGAEVVGQPGWNAWRAAYVLRYYPNRVDFTGDTVVIALGLDEARKGGWDVFTWQTQITYLVHRSIELGADLVLLPYLPVPPSESWAISLFNQGYRSACQAIPRNGNTRVDALPIWCGMFTFKYDFFGPDNDTFMSQDGHDRFAELIKQRLRL